ncbi:hypothetical protein RB597_007728 [Gaeumannomyces tritici]
MRAPTGLSLILAAAGLMASGAGAVDTLVDLGYAKFQGAVTDPDLGVSMWKGIQFAAPPVGELRFAAPADPVQTGTVDATRHGSICPPMNPNDWTAKPNSRFKADEDCLYLSVTAPTAATADSRLPVVVLLQGGGFGSNSSPNWNGREIVSAGNVVLVQFNYRVGMYGFLQTAELAAKGGTLNAGMKDMIKALEWVKANVAKFGGDPDHVVIDGVSAGGSSVGLLMAANIPGGKELFKGGIVESGPWATLRTMDRGEEQFQCLVKEKGCAGSADRIACLRALDQVAIRSSNCWFNPSIDGDLFTDSLPEMFRQGKFHRVPTIWGTDADEGTKNVPQSTASIGEARKFFLQQDGSLTNGSLAVLQRLYLDSEQPVFPSSGAKWRNLANAMGDIGNHCQTRNLIDFLARDGGGSPTWNYNYDVIDPADEAAGFGAWHTVNTHAFWGQSRDNNAPKSYLTTNAAALPLVRGYWFSFIRHLDPNVDRQPGSPEWTPYTAEGRERIFIQTNNTHMERMSDRQAMRCDVVTPMFLNLAKPPAPGTATELDAGLAAQVEAASNDTSLPPRSAKFRRTRW